MTAPPPKRAVAVCASKRRFADEWAVRAQAMRSIALHNLPALYVYHCRVCKGWHLTRCNLGKLARVTVDNPVHT